MSETLQDKSGQIYSALIAAILEAKTDEAYRLVAEFTKITDEAKAKRGALADKYWQLRREHREDEAKAAYDAIDGYILLPKCEADRLSFGALDSVHTNDREAIVFRRSASSSAPLYTTYCLESDGWEPFPTWQDADYFCVFIHRELRMTVTYAEGDLTVVYCMTDEIFNAEILDAIKFYEVEDGHRFLATGKEVS